jgi:hypothetical protein
MNGKDEVKFNIKEINAEKLYRKKLDAYKEMYQEIAEKIVRLSYPKCPNNNTEGGTSKTKIETLLELIEEKDNLEKKIKHFEERIVIINEMKERIFQDDDGFLKDFFSGYSYKSLEKKYSITNPYKLAQTRILKSLGN